MVSRSRWRWLAAGYPALTMLVVVVTANHFWLDGIVAGLLVALVLLAQRLTRYLTRRLARAWRPGTGSEPSPVVPARGELPARS